MRTDHREPSKAQLQQQQEQKVTWTVSLLVSSNALYWFVQDLRPSEPLLADCLSSEQRDRVSYHTGSWVSLLLDKSALYNTQVRLAANSVGVCAEPVVNPRKVSILHCIRS